MLLDSPLSENSLCTDADIKGSSSTLEMNDDEKGSSATAESSIVMFFHVRFERTTNFEKVTVGSVSFQPSLFMQHMGPVYTSNFYIKEKQCPMRVMRF